jgi:hypothetical protein
MRPGQGQTARMRQNWVEGLGAVRDVAYTCVLLWRKSVPERRMTLGEWIRDNEGDSGGWVCAGEQGAVC